MCLSLCHLENDILRVIKEKEKEKLQTIMVARKRCRVCFLKEEKRVALNMSKSNHYKKREENNKIVLLFFTCIIGMP